MSRLAFCWRVAVGAASKLTLPHFCRLVNEIGDDGAKALAVALQSNSSLTRLDLSGNQHAASVSFRCDEECFTFCWLQQFNLATTAMWRWPTG